MLKVQSILNCDLYIPTIKFILQDDKITYTSRRTNILCKIISSVNPLTAGDAYIRIFIFY